MEGEVEEKKSVYSVWAIPPADVQERVKKVMKSLRSEFDGPEFEPHVTVVGAIELTESDALLKFKSACEDLKAYTANVKSVSTGTFFYQCVYLLLHPTPEVNETAVHCWNHFGYNSSNAYMPHLSLLYADLTEEEKLRAKEKAVALDGNFSTLSFTISQLALYKTDTADKTLKSWEKLFKAPELCCSCAHQFRCSGANSQSIKFQSRKWQYFSSLYQLEDFEAGGGRWRGCVMAVNSKIGVTVVTDVML